MDWDTVRITIANRMVTLTKLSIGVKTFDMLNDIDAGHVTGFVKEEIDRRLKEGVSVAQEFRKTLPLFKIDTVDDKTLEHFYNLFKDRLEERAKNAA